MSITEKRRPIIAQIIAIVMLLWAFNPGNPYGYYVLLRIVVCAICVFLALRALEIGNTAWVWVLGVTAVIYNPIAPVHLTREIWLVMNAATIIALALTFHVLRRRSLSMQDGENKDAI